MSDLMQEQTNSGHNVEALVHHHQKRKRFSSEVRKEGKVHRVPCYGQLIFVPVSPGFVWHLNKVLSGFKPDILHLHMPNFSCFWLLMLAKAKRIPWVIHWHSDVVGAAPDWRIKALYPVYRIFEKGLLEKATKVIATSPAYLESSSALSAFKQKSSIAPLGLFDRRTKLREPVPKTNELKLLCIGRLTYYKGHQYLIQALSLLKWQDIPVSLTVVGDGEQKAKLIALTRSLGLEDIVNFVGKLSDEQLSTELDRTNLLCLPSIERTEAFGLVLLEAMRAGKPCLVTDVEGSGMSWVVQDGKTGFVVEHANPKVLADTLVDLSRDKSRLKELGVAARTRFEKHFSIQQVATTIDRIYRDMLRKVN